MRTDVTLSESITFPDGIDIWYREMQSSNEMRENKEGTFSLEPV